MSSSLAAALLARPPRESSGGPSSNRFAYQHTWALCKLLSLHELGEDFLVVLEFHDDVLVLDSSITPTRAEFYQVKTKRTGHWTANALIKAKSQADANGDSQPAAAAPRSILGKMLDHTRDLAPHGGRIALVSNAPYRMKLTSGASSDTLHEIILTDLDGAILDRMTSSLKSELGIDAPPLGRVVLLVDSLSLTDHETHGAGALSRFLERRRPGSRYAVQGLFRNLLAEIRRRANHEWTTTSFDELCKTKSFSRADLEHALTLADNETDPKEQLRDASSQLSTEGLTYRDLQSLGQAWNRYQVEVTDHSNQPVMTFRARVVDAIRSVIAREQWVRLRDLLDQAEAEFVRDHGEPAYPFNRPYLRGAILLEYKAIEQRGLPTLDSQPTTQAP